MSPEEVQALMTENAVLRAEVGALRQQVTNLKGQLQTALVRIAELEPRKPEPPPFVKPNRSAPTESKGPRKKRAAEHNTSRQRAEPTRIEPHRLERCPDCNYSLSGESIDYTREVIELPPPPVEVIKHQVIKRWCPCCGRWCSPKLDLTGQVIGQGRIGVRIASLVSYLRPTLRLPFRAIQSNLETVHSLRLSVGEIVELTHDPRQELQPQADQLKAEVQTSTMAHGDETSWREKGQNGYAGPL